MHVFGCIRSYLTMGMPDHFDSGKPALLYAEPMSTASEQVPCIEGERLLQVYLATVAEWNELQSVEVSSLIHNPLQNVRQIEARIADANERRKQAKYALAAHRQQHGC